jgi:carboxyl-terminal processing protease
MPRSFYRRVLGRLHWRCSLPLLGLFVLGVAGGVVLERHRTPQPVAHAAKPLAQGPEFRLVAEAWNTIRKGYVDQRSVRGRQYTYATIQGMVDALGDTDHSVFLTPEMRREEDEELGGEFAGIGVRLKEQGRRILIDSLFPDTPAQRAGLRPGDIVLSVNGQRVAGMSAEQVQEAVRGPAGSSVALRVRVPDGAGVWRLALERERIGKSSVSWHLLPGTRVAELRISVFSEGTTAALDRALAELAEAGATGLILDLRDDPGGLLDEAVGVASRFLHKGNVALQKDASGRITPLPVLDSADKCDLPMVVLVNDESASGAEVVAGALQDAGRATLVGETTSGMGTILTDFPLSDGSVLELAIQQWLTPNGKSIWHSGITPDETVELPDDAEPLSPQALKDLSHEHLLKSGDIQLLRGLKLLRERLVAAKDANPG